MLALRRSSERGYADQGWLRTRRAFSFAGYHDPAHMGFRNLRVINEDVVMPGEGFDTHPHRDMEILTYVISGQLAHKDSMGNGRIIMPGEVQGMSAGTGITHSEFNASNTQPVHLLQIWITPHTKRVTPSYAEWKPSGMEKEGWAMAASPDGEAGSVPMHQDARMYVATPAEDKALVAPLAEGRFGWLQVAVGQARLGGVVLEAGDGAAFDAASIREVGASRGATLLLFDLA